MNNLKYALLVFLFLSCRENKSVKPITLQDVFNSDTTRGLIKIDSLKTFDISFGSRTDSIIPYKETTQQHIPLP